MATAKPKKAARPVQRRIRRPAAEAKTVILDAAERVFQRFLPDEVGLKEVAREAGVSHALLGHHFGTYENLVEKTLSRRIDMSRDRAVQSMANATFASNDDAPIIDVVVELIGDKLTMRLIVWSLLSGRAARADFLASRTLGLRVVCDAIEARTKAFGLDVEREHIDFSVMTGIAMAIGFGVGGDAISRAIGHDAPIEPAKLRAELVKMTRGYVIMSAKQ